jgi:signal transduction histidine kinase
MRIYILLLLFFIWFDIRTYAQKLDISYYSVKQYTDENGLPQNSVKAMVFDESGFLWLATESGLARFDGKDFKIHDKKNLSISSARIGTITSDYRTHQKYAVTDNLEVINIEKGKATLHPQKINELFIPVSELDSWYGNWNIIYELPLRYPEELVQTFVTHISINEHIILKKDSVQWYENNRLKSTLKFKYKSVQQFFLLEDELYYLPAYSGNDPHQKNILYHLSPQRSTEFTLQGDLLKDPYYGKTDYTLYWNKAANNVFIHLNKSLYYLEQLKNGHFNTRLVLSDFDFKKNAIASACYDPVSKRLFLGSGTKGLFVFNSKPFAIVKANMNDDNEVYYAQAPYTDRSVITPQGYVLGKDIKPRLIENVRDHSSNRYNLLVDRNKNLWTLKWQSVYQHTSDGRKEIGSWKLNHEAFGLYETRDGMIWAGTRNSDFYRIDPRQKNLPAQLITDTINGINCMQEDDHKNLYIGTPKGVYLMNMITMKITRIKELNDKYVRSIHISGDDVWLCTYEDGIFLYRNKQLTSLPTDKEKYLKTAHCILEDKNGYFWITTNKGLFQAKKEDIFSYINNKQSTVFYYYYGKESGFNTNEFNGGCQPCAAALANGYFSFPSLNGLVWYHPDEVIPEFPSSEIYIDKIEAEGKSLAINDTISLDPNPEHLKLFFSSPYFGHLYNLHFEYLFKRSGDNKNKWMMLDQDRSISFTSIPAGTYELIIRKANGFGKSNYSYQKLIIMVAPAYWQTSWFIFILILLVSIMIFLFIRLRVQYIKKKNQQLEKVISVRTSELNKTIDELEDSRESLSKQTHLQRRLIAAITHDIKSPLNYLLITTKGIKQNLEDNEEPEFDVKAAIDAIYSSSFQMYHFTTNLLEYAKMYLEEEREKISTFNLYELIEGKIDIFRYIAARQRDKIINNIPEIFDIRSNRQLLSIIIHNLLDNAIKFTAKGEITFSASVTDHKLLITIEDTGRGMKPDEVKWCNESFSKSSSSIMKDKAGLGLNTVKELLNTMQGTMHVVSMEKKGTKITLLFDYNEEVI